MGFNLENTVSQKQAKKEVSNKTSFLQKEITLYGNSFSNKIKEDFYTEISVLLKAGITLKDALELIQKAFKKEKHQANLKLLSEDIVSGLSLSEAIKKQKDFTVQAMLYIYNMRRKLHAFFTVHAQKQDEMCAPSYFYFYLI